MFDQITLLLATPIAKVILEKFYEGLGSNLAKAAVEKLPKAVQNKITDLGKFVWEKCLRGKPGTDAMLENAAQGSTSDQDKLTEYLNKVLDGDPTLRNKVKELADAIRQEFRIEQGDGGEVWNVPGGEAQKNVFEDNKAPIFKDVTNSPITINYGTPPQS